MHHRDLKKQILESILGNSYDAYVNFRRNVLLPKKKQHRRRVPLWQFLLHLLHFDGGKRYIEWSSTSNLEFRIRDPAGVAELWGSIKDKGDMTYEKFGRALRYYYGKNIIEKVNGKRYFYKFIFSRKTRNFINKFSQAPKVETDLQPTSYITQYSQPFPVQTAEMTSAIENNNRTSENGHYHTSSDADYYKESEDESDGDNDVFSNPGSEKEYPDNPSVSPASSCTDEAYCSDEFVPRLPVAFEENSNHSVMDLAWQDWKMYTKNSSLLSEPDQKLMSSNLFCFRGDSAFRPPVRESPIHFDEATCFCNDHHLECGHRFEINFDGRGALEYPFSYS